MTEFATWGTSILTLRFINLLVLMPCCVQAAFVGFPLAANTNAYSWYDANAAYRPLTQIYSGIVERCEWTGVAKPSIVEVWTVSAGTSNQVVAVDGNNYTNVVLLTKTVTTTNQMSPFTYSYTDPSGSHSATGYPHVTHDFVSALDSKLDSIIPYFADGSVRSNGNYNAYFSDVAESHPTQLDNVWYEWLMASKAGIFSRIGIGYVDENTITTNYGGYVTGGTAYYTRQPPVTRKWLLSEMHANTNGNWTHVDIGAFDKRMYATNVTPVVFYYSGGSNALTVSSLTITGSVLIVSNQSTVATSETVTISGGTSSCANVWYDITGISCTNVPDNSNDVFAVLYTNELTLYGDRPYGLYATDLDERWSVLTNLTEVPDAFILGNNSKGTDWLGNDFNDATEAGAKADAVTDWADDGNSLEVFVYSFVRRDNATQWDAILRRRATTLYATNITTNATMGVDVDFYLPIQDAEYTRDPTYTTGRQWEFDSEGNGYLRNQMQLILSTNLAIGVDYYELGLYGGVSNSLPAWPAGTPTTNGTSITRGYETGPSPKILLKPNFDFVF